MNTMESGLAMMAPATLLLAEGQSTVTGNGRHSLTVYGRIGAGVLL
jgi:hypothetical protein